LVHQCCRNSRSKSDSAPGASKEECIRVGAPWGDSGRGARAEADECGGHTKSGTDRGQGADRAARGRYTRIYLNRGGRNVQMHCLGGGRGCSSSGAGGLTAVDVDCGRDIAPAFLQRVRRPAQSLPLSDRDNRPSEQAITDSRHPTRGSIMLTQQQCGECPAEQPNHPGLNAEHAPT
jgi:hypothetical protein